MAQTTKYISERQTRGCKNRLAFYCCFMRCLSISLLFFIRWHCTAEGTIAVLKQILFYQLLFLFFVTVVVVVVLYERRKKNTILNIIIHLYNSDVSGLHLLSFGNKEFNQYLKELIPFVFFFFLSICNECVKMKYCMLISINHFLS